MFKLFSFLLLVLISFSLTAQHSGGVSLYGGEGSPFNDLPPTSEYGKCYAKCKMPAQYDTKSVQKLVKEASTRLEKVPAQYETKTETVMVKEGGVKYKTIPARYETVTEQVLIKPEETKLKTYPAKYRTESRQVLVTPARGQWVRKKKAPNCFSSNPDDCYVACWEEIPAVYRTEKYQVLSEPARTEETVIPAKYKTVKKRVLAEPARVEEIPIEPEYRTITTNVLVAPASTRSIDIPAEYTSVTEKVLLSEGGYTGWTEILCAERTTSSKVRSVQSALAAAGFDPGPIDGVMGSQTKSALVKFQNAKGLPVGNLNLQTLQALGVSQ